jgi:ABC-type dipeptide/oligopeptide/nickel transport system ATPase component
MTDTLLEVSDLTTELPPQRGGERPVRVCDGVGFGIRRGETLALLGESGCGKSMTALSLMRLLPLGGRVVFGQVRLGDTDLLRLPERAMRTIRGGRMGMIFQEPQTSLNPVLTVGAQIAEAVKVHEGMARGAVPDAGRGVAARRRHPGPGAPRRRVPAPALGRHEAAGHDRHGAGGRSGPADRRRAHHGAGRHHPGAGAAAAEGGAARARHGGAADHPRPRCGRRDG